MGITFNPNDKGINMTLLDNNMSAKTAADGWAYTWVRGSSFIPNTGKYYWEIEIVVGSSVCQMIGVSDGTNFFTGNGAQTSNYIVYYSGGTYGLSGTTISGSAWTTGDIIGIALDMDERKIQMYKNGVAIGGKFNIPTGNLKPLYWSYNSAFKVTANFGASTFKFSPPVGFIGLDSEAFFLIEDGDKISTIKNNEIIVVNDKTESTFKSNGFRDVNVLFGEVTGDVKPMVSSGSLGAGVLLGGATVDKTKYTITGLGVK